MGAAQVRLRIAMLGTRGVPAAYGGFETAAEEIGSRLAGRGHTVTVYCRRPAGVSRDAVRLESWRGMQLQYAPALHLKTAETLSHTALSAAHVAITRRQDVAFVFNAANAPFVPLLRSVGVRTAVHVDGLEWLRDKWSGAGRRYYRWAEGYAVRHADALIADSRGIAEYYRWKFSAETELLSYGAPIIEKAEAQHLATLGLQPSGYHLVVARFEPENHVDQIVAGYSRSASRLPLIVVGGAPYADRHIAAIRAAAEGDERIRLLGPVYDQALLDELYANALTYIHGHSVGGTNPSLLRAMGAGAHVIAWDVNFNRDVAGSVADYFRTPDQLASTLATAELESDVTFARGARLRERARALYDWDSVAEGYENLALRLHQQSVRAPRASKATSTFEPNQEPTRP